MSLGSLLLLGLAALLILGGLTTPRGERGRFWIALLVVVCFAFLLHVPGTVAAACEQRGGRWVFSHYSTVRSVPVPIYHCEVPHGR